MAPTTERITYLALHLAQTSGSHSLLAFRQGHLSVAHVPSTLFRVHWQPFHLLLPGPSFRFTWTHEEK
jgi:hypothetical protein